MSLEVDSIHEIKTSLDINFFKSWFSFIGLFNALTKREVEIISAFAYKRFALSEIILDDSLVDNITMNNDSKREIRLASGLTYPRFIAVVASLRKKGIIVDKKIDKKFLPKVTKDSSGFKLLLKFNFDDIKGNNN